MTVIRVKADPTQAAAVEASKKAVKSGAPQQLAGRNEALKTVRTVTKNGEKSFADLKKEDQTKLIDALVVLTGALE